MLPNLFNFIGRKPSSRFEDAFVDEVNPSRRLPRNFKTERLLVWMWILIMFKSAFIWWACARYAVPFHPLWIVGPSIAFAFLCTAVYGWRR
jgi:hypothetical protein